MRGHSSRRQDILSSVSGEKAGGGLNLPAVTSDNDFSGLPVTTEELDAIEGYLMPQILEFLMDSKKPDQDSKVPQKTEMVWKRLGLRNEALESNQSRKCA